MPLTLINSHCAKEMSNYLIIVFFNEKFMNLKVTRCLRCSRCQHEANLGVCISYVILLKVYLCRFTLIPLLIVTHVMFESEMNF